MIEYVVWGLAGRSKRISAKSAKVAALLYADAEGAQVGRHVVRVRRFCESGHKRFAVTTRRSIIEMKGPAREADGGEG